MIKTSLDIDKCPGAGEGVGKSPFLWLRISAIHKVKTSKKLLSYDITDKQHMKREYSDFLFQASIFLSVYNAKVMLEPEVMYVLIKAAS